MLEVPSGDLINPIYATLNRLLVAQGLPAPYSSISNLTLPLLRETEQETKLRLIAPLFNAELKHRSESQQSAVAAASAQQAAARRDVRLAVLDGYYLCLSARAAEQILGGATITTAEALRVSRALFASDKVTEDHVLRAEADDLAVRQQLLDATRDQATALHTFNSLLHRPLEEKLEAPTAMELADLITALAAADVPAVSVPENREEVAALHAAVKEAESVEAAVRARSRPTVALVVEGGIQGTSYRTGPGANYSLASLVGELNLWDGKQRSSELALARVQRRRVELRLDVVREQLAVEVRSAVTAFTTARQALPSAERRAAAAQRALEIVTARQREGIADQLAFLNARQTQTAAQLNLEITRLRLLIASAHLDRALASTPLE